MYENVDHQCLPYGKVVVEIVGWCGHPGNKERGKRRTFQGSNCAEASLPWWGRKSLLQKRLERSFQRYRRKIKVARKG